MKPKARKKFVSKMKLKLKCKDFGMNPAKSAREGRSFQSRKRSGSQGMLWGDVSREAAYKPEKSGGDLPVGEYILGERQKMK